ncbi:hypothetical protein P3W24_05930 [Luteibacter sp. PPL201]|uniref:Uncharacterized protein n=1 Tax=Luteibacter sahnii TaxID=3021977 RepID=A0ABT6B8V9_9GAMM
MSPPVPARGGGHRSAPRVTDAANRVARHRPVGRLLGGAAVVLALAAIVGLYLGRAPTPAPVPLVAPPVPKPAEAPPTANPVAVPHTSTEGAVSRPAPRRATPVRQAWTPSPPAPAVPPVPPEPAVPPMPTAPGAPHAPAQNAPRPIAPRAIDAAAPPSLAPDDQVAYIRHLLDTGRYAEARRVLNALRRTHPGYDLPQDLRDLAR